MLFDTLLQFDRLGRDLFSIAENAIGAPVDIRRDGDRYVLDVDLPGVDPSSLDVTVEGDALTIRAERSKDKTSEGAQWVVRERRSSTLVRRFTLGDDIDADGIQAGYHDGVLSVVVPVTAASGRHKIPVAVGSGAHKALAGPATEAASDDAGKAEAAPSHAS